MHYKRLLIDADLELYANIYRLNIESRPSLLGHHIRQIQASLDKLQQLLDDVREQEAVSDA